MSAADLPPVGARVLSWDGIEGVVVDQGNDPWVYGDYVIVDLGDEIEETWSADEIEETWSADEIEEVLSDGE